MTIFLVSDAIFKTFPDVMLGVIAFQGVNNAGEHSEVISALRREEELTIERFNGVVVNDHPNIASWRDAYRKFGAKPKDYPSSIENLVKRVIKGHKISHINSLVDIYNTISLRYILPVGGEDLDKIAGDVELTFATENEPPVLLLGEAEERAPKPGEVIYRDKIGAICRRWNWKEADRTKFTESTVRGFIIMEAFPPVDETLMQQALDDLSSLLEQYCGGSFKKFILSAKNSLSIKLDD